MFIVTNKEVVIQNQTLPPGTTLGEIDVAKGLPIKRVLASLSNGCASLQEREADAEPATPDAIDGNGEAADSSSDA